MARLKTFLSTSVPALVVNAARRIAALLRPGVPSRETRPATRPARDTVAVLARILAALWWRRMP